MRVQLWVTKFPATSETFIRNQIAELLQNKIWVNIYAKKKLHKPEALKGYKALADENLVKTFSDIRPISRLQRSVNFLKICCSILFWKHISIFLRSLNFWKYGDRAYKLTHFFMAHYLLKNKIDIIHAHYATNGLTAAIYKDIGVPVKLFVTFHGYDIRMLAQNPGVFDSLKSSCNAIFSISEYNTTQLLNAGFQPSKLHYLPNGIDTSFFKPKNLPKKAFPSFVSVGRLEKIKGFDIFIKSISLLRDKGELGDFIYTIVGDGPERGFLEKLIATSNLKPHIFLVGYKNKYETRNLLQKHQFLVLPSRAEAFPTVVLEAQSCGLPVLATDVGNVKKMIENTGLIIAKDSPKALANGLKEMIYKKDAYPEMGMRGRNRVVENYEIRNIGQRLINYYNLHLQSSV